MTWKKWNKAETKNAHGKVMELKYVASTSMLRH